MSRAFQDHGTFCPESFSLLIFKFRYVWSMFPFHLLLAYQAVVFEELFDAGEVLYIFYKPC